MKYDALALQIFQETLERLEDKKFFEHAGICEMLNETCFIIHMADYEYDYDLIKWMQQKYMPHKKIGEFWWPICRESNGKKLIQAKENRIAFLQRIIEDLMCGE